ncbi:serine hydrolase domain-containing protein [Caulobacter sp.]|uniref:serine hydrolase domain-containing protein n=1 Tax=Caulobacter sp. TaxID=78 RepID=UPI002B471FAC|nr:serine hydrolase domain-containing protein [Caulobacter sp.]HJV41312.1 serine hydrolase domain-containing protein [Caulobacter sp.]
MKLSILALGALLTLPGLAQADTAADRRHAVETGLRSAVVIEGASADGRRLEDRMRALKTPGVAIAVVRNGKLDWARGYGVVGPGGEPVDADTLFQAGSVSKPVAAVTALALVQDGVLSLDAPINAALKSWTLPENAFTRASPVTLRRLLSHAAGATVHGFPGYAVGATIPTVPQILDGAAPANTPPVVVDQPVGVGYRYSGGGYTIVQLAVTDAARKPFPAIARAKLLAPLGMARSTFDQPLAAGTPNVALAHDEAGQPIPGGFHVYPEMAAAGLWTSATELARFVIEVQNASHGRGKVLSRETAREMLTPQPGGWGLGFKVTGQGEALSFFHDGSNAGYKATLIGHPETGDGAVILTNGDQGYQLGQEILRGVAVAYGWSDNRPIVREAAPLALAAQRPFAGTFEIKGLGTFEIREAGDAMLLELRKGQAFKLVPSSEQSFFITEQNIVLTFDDADHGAAEADGQRFTFSRRAEK